MSPPSNVTQRFAAVLVVLATGAGLWRRLQDPLSTPVIPAEDPFTHMALVRGHLLDGSLDPLYEGGRLYPPGMHALLATLWAYTGLPLELVFRYAPVGLGVAGILVTSVLLWRHGGPLAAAVGAWGLAMAPELVFRTTMMSPTAVDMVVLPVFVYALLETLRGRWAWAAALAISSVFLVFSHPWLLAILAPMTLGVVIIRLIPGAEQRMDALGACSALGIIAAALLAAVASCWSQCTADWAHLVPQDRIDRLAVLGAGACAGTLVVLGLLRHRIGAWQARRMHWAWKAAASSVLAASLYAVSRPAFAAGLPEHVHLPTMIGRPVLALAVVGLLLVPWRRSPVALAAAALAAVTYPFVIYNPFDSPFWPHRTAVYLAVATAMLAGTGAATMAQSLGRALHAALGSQGAVRRAAAATLPLLVLLGAATSIQAQSAEPYHWYRLYSECEYEALQEVARNAPADAVIITGDWRPKLVMAAFAHDGTNVWFTEGFFADLEHRNETMAGLSTWAPHVIVVVDPHMQENRHWELSFPAPEWHAGPARCGIASYTYNGGQP